MSAKSTNRRRKKKVKETGEVISEHREPEVVPYDENLLERARTQWQFGDWQSLVGLDRGSLQHHPDRAKLAMLAAAGRLQTDQTAEARHYICLAQDWGASKKLISQILIAGVHNSLGRAAAISNQQHRALQHFENSIAIGAPGSAKSLIANARARSELETMGLLPGSQGRLQQYQALVNIDKQFDNPGNTNTPSPTPISEAHTFYIKLGRTHEDKPIPFLLIDSKSLPRSGLHYLKSTLSRVFGEHFSFCEWYQEPGCCKRMPCALTGFATHAEQTGNLRIRLTKSHDFDLADPIFDTNRYLRRLVLVRDPLFVLTSWFALDQLDAHKAILAKNGISINKIWLAHEKEVLKPAYDLLNEYFNPPSLKQLTKWLENKSQYIAGFMGKWLKPLLAQSENYVQVVCYEDVNHYIGSIATEFKLHLPDTEVEAIEEAVRQAERQFKKREDPFYVSSINLSDYIRSNKMLFKKVANELVELEVWGNLINSQ